MKRTGMRVALDGKDSPVHNRKKEEVPLGL